jgi:hypothetical protein
MPRIWVWPFMARTMVEEADVVKVLTASHARLPPPAPNCVT